MKYQREFTQRNIIEIIPHYVSRHGKMFISLQAEQNFPAARHISLHCGMVSFKCISSFFSLQKSQNFLVRRSSFLPVLFPDLYVSRVSIFSALLSMIITESILAVILVTSRFENHFLSLSHTVNASVSVNFDFRSLR